MGFYARQGGVGVSLLRPWYDFFLSSHDTPFSFSRKTVRESKQKSISFEEEKSHHESYKLPVFGARQIKVAQPVPSITERFNVVQWCQ